MRCTFRPTARFLLSALGNPAGVGYFWVLAVMIESERKEIPADGPSSRQICQDQSRKVPKLLTKISEKSRSFVFSAEFRWCEE